MFLEMVLFEWRYQTRQASFYVAGLLLFTLSFMITAINRVSMGGANLLKNGPYTTTLVMLVFGIFSIFLAATFMSNTAIRNHASKMAELLYCKPIHAAQYQIGRFLGAFSVVIVLYAAVPLGLFVGTLMPWVDPARIGPYQVGFYLNTFAGVSVPTLFGFSCLFYVLALRFRSTMAVNFAALGLLMGYQVAAEMLSSPDYRNLAALLDPFGLTAFFEITRYWTIFDKNNQTLPLAGPLLWNRLLWVGLGVGVAGLFGRLTKPLILHPPKRAKAKKRKDDQVAPPLGNRLTARPKTGGIGLKLVTRIGFEVRQVMASSSFILLLLLAMFLLISMLLSPENVYEIGSWPLTLEMADTVREALSLFAVVVITYYSAEIVWRERQSGIGDIIDSMDVPNYVFQLSKLTAAWLVLFALLAAGMGVAVLVQLASGEVAVDLPQYLTTLFLFSALPWMMLTVLAFFLQVVSPNKYAGMFAFVTVLGLSFGLNITGMGNNLLIFSSSLTLVTSDLNGYGWALNTHFWYMLYWGGLSVALGFAGYALWQRGPQTTLKTRLKGLMQQLGSFGKIAVPVALVVFIAAGAVIYYNTRVLNQHMTPGRLEAEQISYEKTFAEHVKLPLPEMVKVNATVEIYPEQRRIVAGADIVVENRGDQVITKFLVMKPEHTPQCSVTLAGGSLQESGGPGNTYWFVFDEPMQPGEQRSGRFEVVRERRGFREGNEDTTLVRNGTFINNFELFPSFGYQVGNQITDANKRRKAELPPPQRANPLEDEHFHHQTFLGPGTGFIDYETKVSTVSDQIAIAPGYLQREWREGERRWFHYKMDAPMLNFYAYTSARLDVVRDVHNGVNIEVYFHPTHAMNVARMVQSTKDALDYMQQHFGPYQHRQLRIIEFPRYRKFAQSFANTVPFSEAGFLRDMRDPLKVDMVYNTTAHEVAHQWWGHQLVGADVQGSAVLSETLAQYSELMVMKQNLGLMSVRRALKVELDLYLRGRNREVFEEQPLVLTENQNYIHYNKGALVMMAVHGLLGEERLNLALKNLLEAHRFAAPPYPVSLDLQDHLNRVADEKEQAVIAALFERIRLYDLKMKSATTSQRPDGRYTVRFEVEAACFEADGQGRETEIEMDQTVELVLFDQHPDRMTDDKGILYLARHEIQSGTNVVEVVVDKLPAYAGVDPLLRFVDRAHVDNVMRVKTGEGEDDVTPSDRGSVETSAPASHAHGQPVP